MSRDTRPKWTTITPPRYGKALPPLGNVFSGLLCLALGGPASAETITVNTTDDPVPVVVDDGLCSLREALQEVIDPGLQTEGDCTDSDPNAADTIGFAVTGTITLSAALDRIDDIDEGLFISGPSARLLTVSGADQFRVFRIAGGEKVTIEGLTIANGRNLDGGGILNNGDLTIRSTTISGNFAIDDGGGVVNAGTLRVQNSTFSGNKTSEEGGGLLNFGTAIVVNTTFSGNQAGLNVVNPSGQDGGGAVFNAGGNLTLINTTIAGNTNVGGTGRGDGIFTEDDLGDSIRPRFAVTKLQNTLLATNDPANGSDHCFHGGTNPIVDGGGNLDDGTTCLFTQNSSLSNAIAGLDPAGLTNNGGPTDTIALSVSPMGDAIDFGVNAFCADAATVNNLDQRGDSFIRPTDGDGDGNAVCDIGAFESAAVAPSPPPPPPNTPPSATPPSATPPRETPTCSGSTATIFVQDGFIVGGPDSGQVFSGRLRGTPGPDVIVGTAASDIINGLAGNDWICGGRGPDRLKGGAGRDRLFGEAGSDTLIGGTDADRCDGGTGRDRVSTCERFTNP